MEEQQPQVTLPSAPFPAPPPFWKHFTTTNQQRLEEIQSSASTDHTTEPTLPSELTYLTAPAPPDPSNASYPAFNVSHPLKPTPPSLPPNFALFHLSAPNLTKHLPSLLTKITRCILLNFLELTTILSTPIAPPPDEQEQPLYQDKIADLERLFTNALYCVNLYRPHQAREGVIEWLEEEIEKGEEEVRRLDEVKGRIEGLLEEVEGGGWKTGPEDSDVAGLVKKHMNGVEDKTATAKEVKEAQNVQEVQEARKLWQALRALEEAG